MESSVSCPINIGLNISWKCHQNLFVTFSYFARSQANTQSNAGKKKKNHVAFKHTKNKLFFMTRARNCFVICVVFLSYHSHGSFQVKNYPNIGCYSSLKWQTIGCRISSLEMKDKS